MRFALRIFASISLMGMTAGSLSCVILIMNARPLRISRRLDMMRFGPGPALGRAKAATMFPALLGRCTAAGVILARKGNAVILDTSGRQGNANPCHRERNQCQPGPEFAGQLPPQLLRL